VLMNLWFIIVIYTVSHKVFLIYARSF
jgi:hypothetical protein